MLLVHVKPCREEAHAKCLHIFKGYFWQVFWTNAILNLPAAARSDLLIKNVLQGFLLGVWLTSLGEGKQQALDEVMTLLADKVIEPLSGNLEIRTHLKASVWDLKASLHHCSTIFCDLCNQSVCRGCLPLEGCCQGCF